MIDPAYRLEYDEALGVIRMTIADFWEVETVWALRDEILPLLKRARSEAQCASILSDARKFPVQSAPVASAFAQLEEQIGSLRDRMAMVVGSTLAKMQGERAVAGSETA